MSHASRLAVLAGSFDPPTNGHLDMIARAATLFDRVVVALLVNPAKQPLFALDERVAMMRELVGRMPTVEIDTFDGLLADYVRRRNAVAVVRGLRTASEFSEEWQVALMNRHLNPACETVFVVPAAENMQISSRLVREIASLGGSVTGLVAPSIEVHLRSRFAQRSGGS
ncbi:MAG: pantetheine-phosphate adenylyltransferase [Acidobacteriota bacterium]